MKIKNVGDEPINYSEENQALIDTRGREYSPDDEAWIHLDGSAPWGEINPGNTQKAVIAFDIPKKAKPDHLLLKALYSRSLISTSIFQSEPPVFSAMTPSE